MSLAPAVLPTERLHTITETITDLKDRLTETRAYGGAYRLTQAAAVLWVIHVEARDVRRYPPELGCAKIRTAADRTVAREVAVELAQVLESLRQVQDELGELLGGRRLYSVVLRQFSDFCDLVEDLQETCELASSERFEQFVARSLGEA